MHRIGAPLTFAVLLACGGSTTPNDAATPVDAAHVEDAAHVDDAGHDAATTPDTGPREDSGPTPDGCEASFSDCVDFDDQRGHASVTIEFDGFAYSPHCLRVDPGTVVNIPASTSHPLARADCSPESTPLPSTDPVSNGAYTFEEVGSYGYFCRNHGSPAGDGMAGLIIVE